MNQLFVYRILLMVGTKSRGYSNSGRLSEGEYSMSFGMINRPTGNHGLGIFWFGQIGPWAPCSRSNEDSKSAYNLFIIGPRRLGW